MVRRPAGTVLLAFAAGAVALSGCGGNDGKRTEATCDAYDAVQASLRKASVEESPATLAVVERRLAALSQVAQGKALTAAASQARQGWTAFRVVSTSVPHNEFSAREAYFAALGTLDAFTRACGLAP